MAFNILDLLLPREAEFFNHLNRQVEIFCDSAKAFKELVSKIGGFDEGEIHAAVRDIKDLELKGDEIERFIIAELDRKFITPLDREDIHSIVLQVDEAIDFLNNTAQQIEAYRIRRAPRELLKFSDLIVDISVELKKLISRLKEKKEIEFLTNKIHSIENESDNLFNHTMAELFSNGSDAVEIIKFKDIYMNLEDVVNSADHVSKLVRGIMVKQG